MARQHIGSGNLGQAIGGLAGKGGDIVVLAVPYPSLGQVIAHRGAQLAGKIGPQDFQFSDGAQYRRELAQGPPKACSVYSSSF